MAIGQVSGAQLGPRGPKGLKGDPARDFDGLTVTTVALNDGGGLGVVTTSVFGIDVDGRPYYDADGVVVGDEAALMPDFSLVRVGVRETTPSGAPSGGSSADQVTYDGSGASLSAIDVQGAITEVANGRVVSVAPGFGVAVDDTNPLAPEVGLAIFGAGGAPGAVVVVNSDGDGLDLRYALVGDPFQAIESPVLGDVIGHARLHDPVTGASLGYVPVYNMIST